LNGEKGENNISVFPPPLFMKSICFTVTNDLTYDQRMIRICSSLSAAGFDVLLTGRKLPSSLPLAQRPFRQRRIRCFFNRGPLFYAEYNIRLFFFLLFTRTGCVCAIDLDTILPVYLASLLRNIPRVYDAHELFCEMEEIATRPRIHRIWKAVERFAVPRFPLGYTVNRPIADEFNQMYGVCYEVIRNMAVLTDLPDEKTITPPEKRYILYQGAVNEGRCFENLIPAMKKVNGHLIICGTGNFFAQAQRLVKENRLEEKVTFKGMVQPDELREITRNAYLGVTLFSKTGLSNYYSLANRFFDYLHAGIPQLCVDYPVYRELNAGKPFALLIEKTDADSLSESLNNLLTNELLYRELKQNALQARKTLSWQQEEKKLVAFYRNNFR
jgi:glycosyltransferase involved in cell wall biosynthesis